MKDSEKYRPVYPIGVVRQFTGLSERQIRYYEEKDIVVPKRTSGGQRLYSPADIEDLLKVKRLLSRGLNMEEVREVFVRDVAKAAEAEAVLEMNPGASKIAGLRPGRPLPEGMEERVRSTEGLEPAEGSRPVSEPVPEAAGRSPFDPSGRRELASIYPVPNQAALLRILDRMNEREVDDAGRSERE